MGRSCKRNRIAKSIQKAVELSYEMEGKEILEYIEQHPEEAPTPEQMKRSHKARDARLGKIKNPSEKKRNIKRIILIAAVAAVIMAIIATVVIASRGGIGPYIFTETTSDGATIWMTQDPTQEDFEHGSRLN